jgi:hypothetical protein
MKPNDYNKWQAQHKRLCEEIDDWCKARLETFKHQLIGRETTQLIVRVEAELGGPYIKP